MSPEIDPRMRFVADLDTPNTRPLYVPLSKHNRGEAYPVRVHWPVLTPDGGVLMATTEADAQRFADTMNELLDRIALLEERQDTRPPAPPGRLVGLAGLAISRAMGKLPK